MQNRIRWSGYEFEYKEKTADWFWAVGIIIVSVAVVCFIYDNVLFGIFIILAGAILLFTANKEPRLMDYELNEKGLLMNNTMYPHTGFRSFWVAEYKYAPPRLILKTEKLVNPVIVITIETDYVNADTVRNFLLDYIPEEKTDEPMSLRFMEYLGF
ncbi:MAG TPA: hypothetical protein VJH63_03700 [Candidatus Paceibacterota bacterium]